jgi:hypothetical protein
VLQGVEVGIGEANVVALPIDDKTQKAVLPLQALQGGGQLELASLALVFGNLLLQVVKYLGFEQVGAKDGQVFVLRQAGYAQMGPRLVD